MTSASRPMQQSQANVPKGTWPTTVARRSRERGEAYPVIRQICRDMGSDIDWLSSRPENVGLRLTAGDPTTRVCPVCSKGTLGDECWTFVLEVRPGKFRGSRKMAVHARCVLRQIGED